MLSESRIMGRKLNLWYSNVFHLTLKAFADFTMLDIYTTRKINNVIFLLWLGDNIFALCQRNSLFSEYWLLGLLWHTLLGLRNKCCNPISKEDKANIPCWFWFINKLIDLIFIWYCFPVQSPSHVTSKK